MGLGNSGLRLVSKKPVHQYGFQCYPSRAHRKFEGTPVGAMGQNKDMTMIMDFKGWLAGGGVLSCQGRNSFFFEKFYNSDPLFSL